ncbi:LOW QUALITY PROTEIN: hypothetical protein CVT26_005967 [Gymnopilus dilepis]|uniref:Uncharacterized protein n=1 Tax=Gymnopilus dilepis TaxID=231916 RepID=A0A409Y1T5_9AGAR|nr:LOW QUALITY PROTEIN: hypothetical protein CVT26_005967 [Gymnopilus dilepis]
MDSAADEPDEGIRVEAPDTNFSLLSQGGDSRTSFTFQGPQLLSLSATLPLHPTLPSTECLAGMHKHGLRSQSAPFRRARSPSSDQNMQEQQEMKFENQAKAIEDLRKELSSSAELLRNLQTKFEEFQSESLRTQVASALEKSSLADEREAAMAERDRILEKAKELEKNFRLELAHERAVIKQIKTTAKAKETEEILALRMERDKLITERDQATARVEEAREGLKLTIEQRRTITEQDEDMARTEGTTPNSGVPMPTQSTSPTLSPLSPVIDPFQRDQLLAYATFQEYHSSRLGEQNIVPSSPPERPAYPFQHLSGQCPDSGRPGPSHRSPHIPPTFSNVVSDPDPRQSERTRSALMFGGIGHLDRQRTHLLSEKNQEMEVDNPSFVRKPALDREDLQKRLSLTSSTREPRSAPIPKPLDFLSVPGRKKKRIAVANQSVSFTRPAPIWTEAPTESTETEPAVNVRSVVSLPQNSAYPERQTAALAERLVELADSLRMASLESPKAEFRRKSRASSHLFQQQITRKPREEGRTVRLVISTAFPGEQVLKKWVRDEMQSMLGITKDMEILNKATEIYGRNSPLQSNMDNYELGQGTGPMILKPMQINWQKVDGRWNGKLAEMFFQHCEQEKFLGGSLSDGDMLEIRELFFNRLRRLATIIKKYQPSQEETLDVFAKRVKDRHTAELSRQRRTTRRNELKAARTDTALANLPDPAIPIEELTEEERLWLDTYRILREYGEAGMSSDETDEDNQGTYIVRKLEWINEKYSRKVATRLDKARSTRNQYGNAHGSQPRKRKRPTQHARPSERKPPTQLPLNLYREQWYNALPSSHRLLLQPKKPMVMYAAWSDTEEIQ